MPINQLVKNPRSRSAKIASLRGESYSQFSANQGRHHHLTGGELGDNIIASLPNLIDASITAATAGSEYGPYVGAAKMAYNAVGGITGVRNGFQKALAYAGRADPLSRPLYPGEHHAVEGPGTKYPGSNYNFLGPGTQVYKRIARGDVGINALDNDAAGHDLRYGRAKTPADIRVADEILLREFRRDKNADPYVGKLAISAIKNKMALEDRGLLNPMRYAGNGDEKVTGSGVEYPAANLIALARKINKSKSRKMTLRS